MGIEKMDNPYDGRYAGEDYYWGKRPSALCDRLIEMVRPAGDFSLSLLDLGCGEGRNAVYFARHGFRVTGVDLSLSGLKKAERFAQEMEVGIELVHADIITYEVRGIYDVIFSTGTLHYLPKEVRDQKFRNYKDCTSPGGANAFSVLVEKPFIPTAPDAEACAFLYRSGELMGYYWDWEIVHAVEEIFDCMSSGKPHQHAVNRVIARRYGGGAS